MPWMRGKNAISPKQYWRKYVTIIKRLSSSLSKTTIFLPLVVHISCFWPSTVSSNWTVCTSVVVRKILCCWSDLILLALQDNPVQQGQPPAGYPLYWKPPGSQGCKKVHLHLAIQPIKLPIMSNWACINCHDMAIKRGSTVTHLFICGGMALIWLWFTLRSVRFGSSSVGDSWCSL